MSADNVTRDLYYLRRKRRLLSRFDRRARRVRHLLTERFDAPTAAEIEKAARDRFADLIPHLAYVGRPWTNCFEIEIPGALMALALYRTLRERGLRRDEAAEVMYSVYERFYASFPRALYAVVERVTFWPFAVPLVRRYAARSQRRRHERDFVFEFVRGDGVSFDFGVDFIECALCKLWDAVGETEFREIHCSIDFPMSGACGWGLQREQTIAAGDERCTFRFKRGRETPVGWPPTRAA